MSKTFIAISVLIGTIVGAGILGIPYVTMQSGFGISLINMIIIAIAMIVTMLYLGQISLASEKNHHLPGYAEKYLGKKGKMLMFIAFAFGIYSAIVAYLIGEGESLSFLFFSHTNYSLHFGIVVWLIVSLMSYYGLKAFKDGEEIGVILIFILIISITVFAWNKIDVSNLSYNYPEKFFVPFGVILFAFLGFSSIPEVKNIIRNDEKTMKKSIILANIIVFFIYAIFAAVVVGFKGIDTPQIATLALGKGFVLLGMITMFTSYLALSIALIDSLTFDFKIKRTKAWLYTISIPMMLFITVQIFSLASFTRVLGIGGVVSGGLMAILILFMARRSKKIHEKSKYKVPYSPLLSLILIIIFVTAAVLEIINSF